MNFLAKKILFIFLLCPLCAVHASDSQMKTMIRTIYPQHIEKSSVHQLVKYILDGTDYRLYLGKNSPNDARRILSKAPDYQRPNVLMTRYDAILMAIGAENSIVVDHHKKLISVTRNPIYDY